MKPIIPLAALGLAASLAMGVAGYVAGNAGSPALTAGAQPETGRAAVEAIVRDYLVTNPEIMIEVQQALEARQMEDQQLAQTAFIEQASAQIFDAEHDGVIGNPEGDITIVEFFDYNCGYCKRALPDMEALVDANPDLRFVLKEFPILGPDSQRAHVVSVAFHMLMPEAYDGFHRELLGLEGRADEATAIAIALTHGADEEELRREMQNPAIIEAFQQTYELADRLSITGTPSYVVGDEVVFGAMGEAVLSERIAALRAANGS